MIKNVERPRFSEAEEELIQKLGTLSPIRPEEKEETSDGAEVEVQGDEDAKDEQEEEQRAEEEREAALAERMLEEVDVEAMSEQERLEYELNRAQAAVADLHTPVMAGAYQRHMQELQVCV